MCVCVRAYVRAWSTVGTRIILLTTTIISRIVDVILKPVLRQPEPCAAHQSLSVTTCTVSLFKATDYNQSNDESQPVYKRWKHTLEPLKALPS